MPQLTKVVVTTDMAVSTDAAINDSDKTFIVPANTRWHVYGIQVILVTTSTVGTRQLQVDFRDGSLVHAQDETSWDGTGTNGTFAGGTGYAAADINTMDDGTLVTVDTVAAGVITEFTINSAPATRRTLLSGDVIRQTSTDGSGSGFTLTPAAANIGNVICSVLAGATQIKDLTYNYSIAPGLPHLTAVIRTELMTPMPSTMVLEGGYSIRVYDVAAIAAAADDMTVRILVNADKAKNASS